MDDAQGASTSPRDRNDLDEEEQKSAYRWPSVADENVIDDDDNLADLPSHAVSTDVSTMTILKAAHPASKTLRWLFFMEFVILILLLVLEFLVYPYENWIELLIVCYALLTGLHLIVALSLFGLLYDPWHNNIVKILKAHQGGLAAVSFCFLAFFSVASVADGVGRQDTFSGDFSSVGNPTNRSLGYHIVEGLVWLLNLVLTMWSAITLTREKFDITTGTGCCPVILCRACRVTCFLGIPDSAVGIRYHQHGEHRGVEDISINTFHTRRERTPSRPRKLPMPGEDKVEYFKRGSVDYVAPIWSETTAVPIPEPRKNSEPRLSGSAPANPQPWNTEKRALFPPAHFPHSRSMTLPSHGPVGKAKGTLGAPLLDKNDRSDN